MDDVGVMGDVQGARRHEYAESRGGLQGRPLSSESRAVRAIGVITVSIGQVK